MNSACANIALEKGSSINKVPNKSNDFSLGGRFRSNINNDNRGKRQQHRHDHEHRRLREHHYDTSTSISTRTSNDAKFIDKGKQTPVIMSDILRRNKERLKDFEKALKEYRNFESKETGVTIEKKGKIEKELQQFGYSLYEPFTVESSILQTYSL